MTTTEDILARHVNGQETLTPSALAKVRQAQDFEQLEDERLAHEAALAEQVSREAEHASAVAAFEQDLAGLWATLEQAGASYAALVAARQELNHLMPIYVRKLKRATKMRSELRLGDVVLPPRINAAFILADADREARGMRPRHRHPLLGKTTPASHGQHTQ